MKLFYVTIFSFLLFGFCKRDIPNKEVIPEKSKECLNIPFIGDNLFPKIVINKKDVGFEYKTSRKKLTLKINTDGDMYVWYIIDKSGKAQVIGSKSELSIPPVVVEGKYYVYVLKNGIVYQDSIKIINDSSLSWTCPIGNFN